MAEMQNSSLSPASLAMYTCRHGTSSAGCSRWVAPSAQDVNPAVLNNGGNAKHFPSYWSYSGGKDLQAVSCRLSVRRQDLL